MTAALDHLSQLVERSRRDPAEVVRVGQRVRVLEVDTAHGRINLSLRCA